MSKGTVLVTGANGYVAARTVEAFLQAGYDVRGTVRSLKSAKPVQEALSSYGDKLSFVEIPDITAPGAFDEAVKGVVGVAHLAAPVSLFFTDPEPVIKTAKVATLGALESAAKESSVKSFVLMSSITAVRGNEEAPYIYTEKDWNNFAPAFVEEKGKDAPGPLIYAASKVAAEKVFWEFQEKQNPSFTMTATNPVFIAGPPLVLPSSPEDLGETYKYIWDIFAGGEIKGVFPGFDWFVDVRDVAKLVVYGVDHSAEADKQRYISSGAFRPPQAVADILREAYPDRRNIIREGNPGEGYTAGSYRAEGPFDVDGSKASKALGEDYISFEKLVLDSAKAFERYL